MKKGFFLLLLPFVFILGCNLKDYTEMPEDFDLGFTENNVYTNDYFKLKMNLPDDWALQSKEDLEALMQLGETFYEDESMKKLIKASDVRSATLLGMFKYPLDSIVTFNPSFLMLAENIRIDPRIKTGEGYLKQAKSMMKQSKLDYEFDEVFGHVKLDGQDFDILSLTLDYALIGTIKQQYYTTVMNGFALSAIITYTTDAEKDFLVNVVNNITFED